MIDNYSGSIAYGFIVGDKVTYYNRDIKERETGIIVGFSTMDFPGCDDTVWAEVDVNGKLMSVNTDLLRKVSSQ